MRDKIFGWIRSRSIDQLASCSEIFWGEALSSPHTISCLKQVEGFFKKNSAFANSDCDRQALTTFLRAEKICRITNRRLDFYYVNRDRLDPDVDLQISKAEQIVSQTLGDFRTFIGLLPTAVRLTSGATASTPRSQAFPWAKVKLSPWATLGAAKYLIPLSSYYGYPELRTKTAFTNRVEVVPKNWKTGRTIACEPEGNLPLQLALDGYIKKRLRRKLGIDLSDQSRNQNLAKEGALTQRFATIDLSMASDTLSLNTARWLIPSEWYKYLKDTRSPVGRLSDGTLVPYAKLSSMGNGFTFSIETLIFSSLCKAVGSRDFSVYGDDIIIETELVPKLTTLLSFFGFLINHQKSFTSGPFRESCGANWHGETDVTPFRIQEWSTARAVLSHNVNGLASRCIPGGTLAKALKNLIEEFKLPFVPFNENSMSGIFIDIQTSYTKKLLRKDLRKHLHCLMFKGYVPDTHRGVKGSGTCFDTRSLFLWHLDKGRLKDITFREDPVVVRSGTTRLCTKYVRKWVHWFPPVAVIPVHLYWWTDYIAGKIP
jgi:hypothetical protein